MYMINVKQIAKFVVALSDKVAPQDIEEGMRVGVDRNKYQIQIPLPPKIDPTVSMMQVRASPYAVLPALFNSFPALHRPAQCFDV